MHVYSSGTTGRPKGIFKMDRGQLSWGAAASYQLSILALILTDSIVTTVYLVPAPLYSRGRASHEHELAARRRHSGGSLISFDSLETLRLIETYRVTHAQFVPTMFVANAAPARSREDAI